MVYWDLGRLLSSLFDSIFRPTAFVEAETTHYAGTRWQSLRQSGLLLGIYVVNVMLYAVPLTLAGIGVPSPGDSVLIFAGSGARVAISNHFVALLVGFLLNSAYISVAATLTFVTYHLSAVLTLNSSGFLQSLHTVVYSTSAYLAALFTLVWSLDMHAGLSGAAGFLRAVQLEFVYSIIDVIGVPLELTNYSRPTSISAAGVSPAGTYLLALIALVVGYYVYSLYLGARINHEMSRTSSFVAILFVCVSPVLYVAGTVMAVGLA